MICFFYGFKAVKSTSCCLYITASTTYSQWCCMYLSTDSLSIECHNFVMSVKNRKRNFSLDEICCCSTRLPHEPASSDVSSRIKNNNSYTIELVYCSSVDVDVYEYVRVNQTTEIVTLHGKHS